MPTIGMGIIARNAEATIRDCLESFLEHIEQCVVVKAGESTDATPQILDELKLKYPDKLELYDFEWIDDFSAARNFCFSKLKTDWLLWCDADDILYQAEKLHKLVDEAHAEVGAIWFSYHYAVDEFGNPTTIYERERLLRAKFGWVWQSRIHETVSPLQPCKYVRSDDVIYIHRHTAGEGRSERNFRILNIMHKENPEDKRIWLYLGHQNFAAGFWAKASEWYLKFGTDLGAIPLERFQSLCYCSKAMRNMQDKQAIDVALMAVELFPEYKDGYLELAHSYLTFGLYDKAIHFAKISDNKELIRQPPPLIFINPLEYTFNKYALLSECYLKKGDLKTARNWTSEAYKVRPSPDVKNNIDYIDQLVLRDRITESIKVLAVHLLDNKELVKLPSLLASTPYWFRDTVEYGQLTKSIRHYTSGIIDKPDIVETEGNSAIVNIANVVNPEKLMAELDEKYQKVTVVCPMPSPQSQQVNTFSQRDIEELIVSKEGRHIINLRREPTRLWFEYDRKPKDDQKAISMRFYVGQGLEFWSPETIAKNGCGGSETAVAMMAQELAKLNCDSIVYAMDNQVWNGVIYRNFRDYNPEAVQCHLFISSRVPELFQDNILAKQKWLWAHDIHFWDRLTPEIAERIDVIIALTHWHAEHLKRAYPFLKDCSIIDLDDHDKTYDDLWTPNIFYPDGTITNLPKLVILGDAIDVKRFRNIRERRILHRFVWCSSPDRGLEELLQMWGSIKKGLPDAELKIFYGWDYFDKSLYIPVQREFKERIKQLIQQDGVEWCGRIGQVQIVRELMKADCMVYPPHAFRETYGIAFLEAQAAGCLVFYRQNGALGETVGDRGVPIPIEAKQDEVVQIILEALSQREECGRIRWRAKRYGLQRTWAKQAEKLLNLYWELENEQNNGNQGNK